MASGVDGHGGGEAALTQGVDVALADETARLGRRLSWRAARALRWLCRLPLPSGAKSAVRKLAQKLAPVSFSLGEAAGAEPTEALRKEWTRVLTGDAKACALFLSMHGSRWANECCTSGAQPLGVAAREKRQAIWFLLRLNGADPRRRDALGRNALLRAAHGGQMAMLLDAAHAGADPTEVDDDGQGALTLAAEGWAPSEELIAWLLDRVEPCKEDRWGRNALHHLAANTEMRGGGVAERAAAQLAARIDPTACGVARSGEGERLTPCPADVALRAERWGVLDAMLLSPLISEERRLAWARKAASRLPQSLALAESRLIAGQAEAGQRVSLQNDTGPARSAGGGFGDGARSAKRL
jgi:hypothetical protein